MTRSLERHIRNLDFLRTRTRGKFLFAGEEKVYVRSVTYGPSELPWPRVSVISFTCNGERTLECALA